MSQSGEFSESLARKAYGIQMRRGWYARPVYLHSRMIGWAAMFIDIATAPFGEKTVLPGVDGRRGHVGEPEWDLCHPDPLTALVMAEAWHEANAAADEK